VQPLEQGLSVFTTATPAPRRLESQGNTLGTARGDRIADDEDRQTLLLELERTLQNTDVGLDAGDHQLTASGGGSFVDVLGHAGSAAQEKCIFSITGAAPLALSRRATVAPNPMRYCSEIIAGTPSSCAAWSSTAQRSTSHHHRAWPQKDVPAHRRSELGTSRRAAFDNSRPGGDVASGTRFIHKYGTPLGASRAGTVDCAYG